MDGLIVYCVVDYTVFTTVQGKGGGGVGWPIILSMLVWFGQV